MDEIIGAFSPNPTFLDSYMTFRGHTTAWLAVGWFKMSCFLINEQNELIVPLSIEKFMSVELEDDCLVINGIVKIPTKDILEIKIRDD